MFIVGKRFLPWLLVQIAKIRSSELNTLGVLAIALGFASIAYVAFDASFALGSFLAGVMLGESEIGKKSAENTLSMRDTFSVLFFVSVGMLCAEYKRLHDESIHISNDVISERIYRWMKQQNLSH